MRGRSLRLFVALALAALAACGSKGTTTDAVGGSAGSGGGSAPTPDGAAGRAGGGSDAADAKDATAGDRPADLRGTDAALPTTPTEICRAAVAAICERIEACLGIDYRASDCERVSVFCPDYYFNDDSSRTPASVAACLGPLRARTCTDVALGLYPACLTPGKRGDDVTCAFPSQCKSNLCRGLGDCSTCVGGGVPVGSPCSANAVCAFGAFCSSLSNTCVDGAMVTYAKQGEPCGVSTLPAVGCVGDLQCYPDGAGAKKCQPALGLGQPCDSSKGAICALGLVCPGGVEPKCTARDACGGMTCDATSYCKISAGNAACAPLGTVGEACSLGTVSGAPPNCAPPLICGGAGKCVAPQQAGDACGTTKPCADLLRCGAGGTCELLKANACPVDAGAGPRDGGAG